MLSIQLPVSDVSDLAESADLLKRIKGCELSALYEWKIPCGSGIQLTIKLEGPVKMRVEPQFFDQAIRLLEVARDGVGTWPGEICVDIPGTGTD